MDIKISLFLKRYCLGFIIILFYGCIEPFEAEFEDFESAIVIEATITNELKQQTVFLTRTFEFEAVDSRPESNANVSVVGGGETFTFQQTDTGVYVSEVAFAAQPGVDYQLLIETQDGRSYSSTEAALTSITQIDDVRADRITDGTNGDGVAIFIDSFDPTGSSLNYRYTYEETYRVIAPDWFPRDLVGDPNGDIDMCDVIEIPKELTEGRVCYSTDLSNTIILTDTNDLDEDRVANFMVRFIGSDNFIMSHRYSILVKQHVQSNAAYSFYEALRQFSATESLFSETQPGFLEGNVTSQDSNEKVLGFFDVASVTEKRIFFDYTDFYPDEPLPPYIDPCRVAAPPIRDEAGGCVLRPILEDNRIKFSGYNDPFDVEVGLGPFLVVPKICGDCRELGGTEVPEFWIE